MRFNELVGMRADGCRRRAVLSLGQRREYRRAKRVGRDAMRPDIAVFRVAQGRRASPRPALLIFSFNFKTRSQSNGNLSL